MSNNLQHEFIPCSLPDCRDPGEHCHHEWCGAPKAHSIHVYEPAATPEAQIPEVPVRLFRMPGIDHLFVAREDYLKLEAQLDSSRTERDRLTQQRDQFLEERKAATEDYMAARTELAALRVERDRAWNEALETAATHCEESEVMLPIEKFMGTKQALGAAVALALAGEIRSLARPISAEKPE